MKKFVLIHLIHLKLKLFQQLLDISLLGSSIIQNRKIKDTHKAQGMKFVTMELMVINMVKVQ